jgi:hypothetical protein
MKKKTVLIALAAIVLLGALFIFSQLIVPPRVPHAINSDGTVVR